MSAYMHAQHEKAARLRERSDGACVGRDTPQTLMRAKLVLSRDREAICSEFTIVVVEGEM